MKKFLLLLMCLAMTHYVCGQFILAGDTSAPGIFHKVLNKSVTAGSGTPPYYIETNYLLDLNNDGTSDVCFTAYAYSTLSGSGASCSISMLNDNLICVTSLPFGSGSYINPMNYNDTISQNNPWYTSPNEIGFASSWVGMNGSGDWGIWNGLGFKYIGLKIKIGGNFFYGWVKMMVSTSSSGSALISLKDCGIQKAYYPLPEINAQWNMNLSLLGYPGPAHEESYSIILSGDTLIKGLLYHKFMIPYVMSEGKSPKTIISEGYKGAFRQDVLNRKVFIVPPADTTEQLLYDFSMKVGDTVKGYLENNLDQKDVVLSLDSVLVGNTYRNRWEINSGYNIYFIEGIGSTYGLIQPSPGQVVDWADISLNCFRQNGVTLYPDALTNCDLINSAGPVNIYNNPISIYPNPSNGSFIVDMAPVSDISRIEVSDLFGNTILQRPTGNQKQVVIENLKSGVYILTTVDLNNKTTSYKIISCP